MATIPTTTFSVNYQKRKNVNLFTKLQNNPHSSVCQVQNYIPIYDRFFSLNNTNYNSINLNHLWYVSDIKDDKKDDKKNDKKNDKKSLKKDDKKDDKKPMKKYELYTMYISNQKTFDNLIKLGGHSQKDDTLVKKTLREIVKLVDEYTI